MPRTKTKVPASKRRKSATGKSSIAVLSDAPIEDVYRAWTDPAVMATWFFVEEGWSAEVVANAEARRGSFRERGKRAPESTRVDCIVLSCRIPLMARR